MSDAEATKQQRITFASLDDALSFLKQDRYSILHSVAHVEVSDGDEVVEALVSIQGCALSPAGELLLVAHTTHGEELLLHSGVDGKYRFIPEDNDKLAVILSFID